MNELNTNEEKIVVAISLMVLHQILLTIIEVVMIEAGAWNPPSKILDVKVKEARREDQPKYYLLQTA